MQTKTTAESQLAAGAKRNFNALMPRHLPYTPVISSGTVRRIRRPHALGVLDADYDYRTGSRVLRKGRRGTRRSGREPIFVHVLDLAVGRFSTSIPKMRLTSDGSKAGQLMVADYIAQLPRDELVLSIRWPVHSGLDLSACEQYTPAGSITVSASLNSC